MLEIFLRAIGGDSGIEDCQRMHGEIWNVHVARISALFVGTGNAVLWTRFWIGMPTVHYVYAEFF